MSFQVLITPILSFNTTLDAQVFSTVKIFYVHHKILSLIKLSTFNKLPSAFKHTQERHYVWAL